MPIVAATLLLSGKANISDVFPLKLSFLTNAIFPPERSHKAAQPALIFPSAPNSLKIVLACQLSF